jgi:probable phosphoglycerate mutase
MIILMRHGADDPDRYGGWSPFGLTEEGRRQVRAAKERLLGKGIEAVFTSDLPRARETADIVAAALGLPVTELPQFRETNNGLLAGMPKSEGQAKYPGLYWSALDWTRPWPGGESPEAFFHRIETAWRAFREQNRGRTVLLVSHGGVMNVILCLENGVPYTNRETRYPIAAAEIVELPA